MAWWSCNACGGTYSDTDAVGSGYYHVCPPVAEQTADKDPITGHPLFVLKKRPGHRDETLTVVVDPHSDLHWQTTKGLVSEGAGRTALKGPPG